jgi:hypothetical protein
MENIRECERFRSTNTWDWGDYQDLIDTFGFETMISVDAGSYSGDTFCILRDGEMYGYLEFGWGSCSGCDALLACNNHNDLEELQMSLYNDIKWFDTLSELKEYFRTHDWEGDWCWHEEEHKVFREKVLNLTDDSQPYEFDEDSFRELIGW